MNPNAEPGGKDWKPPKSLQELQERMQQNQAGLFDRPDQERAAVYSRVSSIDPKGHSFSMDYQPDRSEEYVKEKGWQLVASYADPDFSGRNSDRPGLQALLKDIESGKVTVVVVHRLDRLYRNLESLLRFLRLIRLHRVRLVSVTEELGADHIWGRMMLYFFGALAEMLVWQTSQRTREIKQELSRKGLHNGPPPYGYCRGLCSTCIELNGPGYCPHVGEPDRPESRRGRIPVPHPIDRHAVLMIHTLYDQGHSYLEVADLLNTNDYQLPDGTTVRFHTKGNQNQIPGRPFHRDSIRDVILNDFYAGYVIRRPNAPLNMDDDHAPGSKSQASRQMRHESEFRLNRRTVIERNPGKHEAIVPEALWERNQLTRQSRGKTPNTKKNPVREYMLSSTACCWECYAHDGRRVRLQGLSANGHYYYRCATLQQEYKQRRKPKPEFSKVLGEINLRASPNGMGKELLANHRPNLRQELMEEQVNVIMERITIPEEWCDTIIAYSLSPNGLNAFRMRRFNLLQDMARVHEMRTMRAINQAEYERLVLQINRELNQLRPSVQPEGQHILPLLRDFKSLWHLADNSDRRLLLNIMFDGLYFDHEHKLRKVALHSPFEQVLNIEDLVK